MPRKRILLVTFLTAFMLMASMMLSMMLCGCSDDVKNNETKNTQNVLPPPENGKGWKPIIYLYPREEINVSVTLPKESNITCSYPKYHERWNVVAQPNGNLFDTDTSRNLYSLYYECDNDVKFTIQDDGFIVRGEDAAPFLEDKLAVLGLTEREAEEFIIYWLPKLEANEYNYIRFATSDEINENMPLEISPSPDTTIRILMTFKGIDVPIEVDEQKLASVQRDGFVAVEWGGTELN